DDARQRQRVGDIHEGSNSRVAAHQTPTEAIEVLRFSRFVTAWPHPRRSSAHGSEPDPRDLLIIYPSEPMTMWPISTRVNTPANDDPSLLDQVDGISL
ncbi:MAG: hypothetical protein ACLQF1_11625, partial [Methyloceanibacter sp.]